MTNKIIDFEELVQARDKDNFDKLLDSTINTVRECYEQKVDVYTMLLERMRSIPIENEVEMNEAFDEIIAINDEVIIDLDKVREYIKKL
jgi:hypothetical protein